MIADPAKRIVEVEVSRLPLMLMASAPACHIALVTNWRSRENTRPSESASSSASSAPWPGASSRVRTKPGPVSGIEPTTEASSRPRTSVAGSPPSCSLSSAVTSAWRVDARAVSWSTSVRRPSISLMRSARAWVRGSLAAVRLNDAMPTTRPMTTVATTSRGERSGVERGRPAASRRSAAAAYPGSSGRSSIVVSSVIDASGRRAGVGVGSVRLTRRPPGARRAAGAAGGRRAPPPPSTGRCPTTRSPTRSARRCGRRWSRRRRGGAGGRRRAG